MLKYTLNQVSQLLYSKQVNNYETEFRLAIDRRTVKSMLMYSIFRDDLTEVQNGIGPKVEGGRLKCIQKPHTVSAVSRSRWERYNQSKRKVKIRADLGRCHNM